MIKEIKKVLRRLHPLKFAIKDGATIGEGIHIEGRVFWGSEPYLITLKDHVAIARNVSFITHDGGSWAFRDEAPYKGVVSFGKIVVDEYTIIGAGVTIMPGVHIGKRCIIGTGSIVTKNIPDYSVAVGVPARVICGTYEYAEKMKNKMPDHWDVEAYHKNKKEYLLKMLPTP